MFSDGYLDVSSLNINEAIHWAVNGGNVYFINNILSADQRVWYKTLPDYPIVK